MELPCPLGKKSFKCYLFLWSLVIIFKAMYMTGQKYDQQTKTLYQQIVILTNRSFDPCIGNQEEAIWSLLLIAKRF